VSDYSIWVTLEIKQTSDKAEIRRAYAKKLKQTNPEDDPQGFQALRSAYDAALKSVSNSSLADRYPVKDTHIHPESKQSENAATKETKLTDYNEEEIALPFKIKAETDNPNEEKEDEEEVALPFKVKGRPSVEGEKKSEDNNELHNDQYPDEDREPTLLELLGESMSAVGAHLRTDPEHAKKLFSEILQSSSLDDVAFYLYAEKLAAKLIASAVPASDILLDEAIRSFGWSGAVYEQNDYHSRNVLKVLERRGDIGFLSNIQRPGHEFYYPWMALSRKPAITLRMATLSATNVQKIKDLFYRHDIYGLRETFNPKAVLWWEKYFSKPRITGSLLFLSLFTLFGVVWFWGDIPTSGSVMWPLRIYIGLIAVMAIAFPSLALAARQHLSVRIKVSKLRFETEVGWIVSWLFLFLIVMMNPRGSLAAYIILIWSFVTILLVDATYVDQPKSEENDGVRVLKGIWKIILVSWAPVLIVTFSSGGLQGFARLNMLAIGLLLITIRVRGERQLINQFGRTLPRQHYWVSFFLAFVVMVGIGLVIDKLLGPKAARTAWSIAALFALMIRWLYANLSPKPSSILIGLGAIFTFMFCVLAVSNGPDNTSRNPLANFGRPLINETRATDALLSDIIRFRSAVLNRHFISRIPTLPAGYNHLPHVTENYNRKLMDGRVQSEFHRVLIEARPDLLLDVWRTILLRAQNLREAEGDAKCALYFRGKYAPPELSNIIEVAQADRIKEIILSRMSQLSIGVSTGSFDDQESLITLLMEQVSISTDMDTKILRKAFDDPEADISCELRIEALIWLTTNETPKKIEILRAISDR